MTENSEQAGGMDITLNVTVTDDKINALGASMVTMMREINYSKRGGHWENANLQRWKLSSAARILEILGIPCKREQNEGGEYVSVTICGVTFSTDMEG